MNLSIVLICLHYSFWAIEAKYTAAVVEFFPEQNKNLTPRERLYRNVDKYIAILDELSHKSKVDIVVYPEATIATNAPIATHADVLPYAVEVEVNETSMCNATVRNFLTTLACAASHYDTYIVVNLYEKTPCKESEAKKCPEDGWHFYNTNVALNRNGSVISKYRKYNLFGEIFMTRPTKADISIFHTDFNETFAMFTCFDILFKQPALDLVYTHNVKSVIYPTMWFSELPFLTALQAQQQWAYATNVTFLASGANNRRRGSGGTGIYQGTKGPLLFTIVANNKSKELISTIPSTGHTSNDTAGTIDKKAKKMDGFYLLSDNLESYTSELVAPYQTEVKATVCSRDEGSEFCCHFEMELEWQMNDTKNHYQYHMVAFSGVRSFTGVYNGGIEICGLVACINHSLSSCGKRFSDYNNVSWPINFKKIIINAQFDFDENKVQYPNSLLSNIQPINVDAFNWTSEMSDKRINRTYTLMKPQNRLMTFAIYGRDFNRDSPVGSR